MPDFGKPFFDRHQRELVAFANTRVGRWFFQLKKGLGVGPDFRVMALFPNAVSGNWRVVDGKLVKTTVFSTDNHFQKRLEYVVGRAAQVVGPALAWKLAAPSAAFGFLPLVAMTVTDFVPVAGANSPIDGYVYNIASGTWAALRGATDGTHADSTGTSARWGGIKDDGSQWTGFYRSIFHFDTSTIGDGDTIESATVSLYVTSKSASSHTNAAVTIVSSNPAADNAITTADYDTLGTTKFCSDLLISDVTTSAYNDRALNASGLAAISKTGLTKFGGKMAQDADNSEPTKATVDSFVVFRTADNDSNKPTLTVTHANHNPDFFNIL